VEQNTIYLKLNQAYTNGVAVRLHNLLGELVYAAQIYPKDGDKQFQIELSNKTVPGIYLIAIASNDKEIAHQKIIIK
jgi:hypothetical protein